VNEPDQEREPDRVGPKVAAGVAVAGAGVLWGPGAALLLGAASPLFESLAERAWQELRPDARQRAAQVLSTAAGAAGCDAGQLGELIGASEATRLQAGLAMRAAERTAWPPQVVALGRVLAAGLIVSDDQLNVPQFALDAMTDLGRLHVSLLELLVRYEPEVVSVPEDDGGVPLDDVVPRPYGDGPSRTAWVVGGRIWTELAIFAVRPQQRPVLMSVTGTLVRHGLAVQADKTLDELGEFGHLEWQIHKRAILEAYDREDSSKAAALNSTTPTVRSWSPTELGEQVLGFYEEAGTEAN
jgi:hypothetical protein